MYRFNLIELHDAFNFACVSLVSAVFNPHNVETKITRNFTGNIFGYYTSLLEGYHFRVIEVNVKSGSICQSE